MCGTCGNFSCGELGCVNTTDITTCDMCVTNVLDASTICGTCACVCCIAGDINATGYYGGDCSVGNIGVCNICTKFIGASTVCTSLVCGGPFCGTNVVPTVYCGGCCSCGEIKVSNVCAKGVDAICVCTGCLMINTLSPGVYCGGCCSSGTICVRCLVVKCKATLGATDPPWVLYDPNTREQVAADIVRQVPEEKQGGATLFYNKDTKQMEYYMHTENKYYKLISEEITQ